MESTYINYTVWFKWKDFSKEIWLKYASTGKWLKNKVMLLFEALQYASIGKWLKNKVVLLFEALHTPYNYMDIQQTIRSFITPGAHSSHSQ